MVRAPCCEKMGLKKGPWTSEEDKILINYIKLYGHGNWRALPRQAGADSDHLSFGLLRCGKSCRLRWTNYLRPDIKRGNFTKEEEDTIISLHETLGNRWSAIAAKLPGRTDNEIKNVWHTHLKKRLNKQHQSTTHETNKVSSKQYYKKKGHAPVNSPCPQSRSSSPQLSTTSGISYVANDHNDNNRNSTQGNANNVVHVKAESFTSFIDVDEDFWSEVLSADDSKIISNEFERLVGTDIQCQVGLSSSSSSSHLPIMDTMQVNGGSVMSDNMEFWSDLFARAGELTELPHFD